MFKEVRYKWDVRILRSASLLILLILVSASARAQPANGPSTKPRLILLIAIDQFRYDYLTRFRNEYSGGLKMMLERGASFVNANLEHYPTVTAVGHSTMLSGATPGISGIIGNDWYDRESAKQVTSVSDDATKLVGAEDRAGSSPRRLLVSTVGDEIKRSGATGAKVIGLSLKDRSAILPAGRMADAAYWFDEAIGGFVSSTWYFAQLPAWAQEFNAGRETQKFAGKLWLEAKPGQEERRLPGAGPTLNAAVYGSPYGNDLLESFAEKAIASEQLGMRGTTDLLSVSFSSNDAIGHRFGPDSPEAHQISLAVDQTIGRLFAYIEKTIGMKNVLVALTADHAVSPSPEVLIEQKMPGGRIKGNFFQPMQQALEARFGAGLWLLSTAGSSPYLNYDLMRKNNLDPDEVIKVAARAIAQAPRVMRVYTREQLTSMRAAADVIDARVMRGFCAKRSGDLEVVLEPYWIRGGTSGATHGTPYNYDTHIPLLFMGPGIRPGRYYRSVALNDLAPTLSALLDVEIPSGSVGRILDEIIQ